MGKSQDEKKVKVDEDSGKWGMVSLSILGGWSVWVGPH